MSGITYLNRRTDGRTDGWTDRQTPILTWNIKIPPPHPLFRTLPRTLSPPQVSLAPHQPLSLLNHQSQLLPIPLPSTIYPTSHLHLPQPKIQVQLHTKNQILRHRTHKKPIQYTLPPVHWLKTRQSLPSWIVFLPPTMPLPPTL